MGKKFSTSRIQKIHQILEDLNRWSRYKKNLCQNCEASCCYMPVEVNLVDLIALDILSEFELKLDINEQVKIALKSPFIKRFTHSTQKFTLSTHPDGRCIFLRPDNTCSVYEKRPLTCKNHPQIGPKPHFCAFLSKN